MIWLDIIDTLNNVIGLLLMIVSFFGAIYLFFVDPLRRWTFFGYRPTVVLALLDRDTNELHTIGYRKKDILGRMLPQGGIYTSDILEAVEGIAESELGLGPNSFDVEYIKEIGTIKASKKKKRLQSFQYGGISMFPSLQGKGYILCICRVDKNKVSATENLGVLLEDAKFMSLSEFSQHIANPSEFTDPKKSRLYSKIIKVIEEWISKS